MDISENGRQIGEKLFTLLNEQQKKALTQYVLDWKNKRVDAPVRVVPNGWTMQILKLRWYYGLF